MLSVIKREERVTSAAEPLMELLHRFNIYLEIRNNWILINLNLPPLIATQVVTGSHDSTIRTWDLRTGKTSCTLTYHKKAVRALAAHPSEHGMWVAFVSVG